VNTNRREQIKQLLEERQQVSIREVSDLFGVSIATARRDLDALADHGKVERLHGGARLMIGQAPPELPSLQRCAEQSDEKLAIAVAAAQLISDNETIFLGSGTTVLELARRLPRRNQLTVMTNSLLVAHALAERRDLTLIVVGGVLRQSEGSLYGHLTELVLGEINASKAFFGIRAISLENGLTNDFVPEVSTDRKILRMAREVILLADHTKFERVATALVCSIQDIHRIITDNQVLPEVVAEFEKRGIQIVLAPQVEKTGG
jgi:DeoR/GlpR family transcriptional regulator of sugar metabolism